MNKYRLSDETRLHHWHDGDHKSSVALRQLIAIRDFADVPCGSRGGWVEDEAALSQEGDCWLYDQNSVVFAGAQVTGNARITQPCVISHHARIGDNVWVDGAEISHGARLCDNVTVQASQVRGECHL